MTSRITYGTGSAIEESFGYSRVVRSGPAVAVAGTTSMTPAGPIGEGDAYVQTQEILERVRDALERVDASLADVTRTRVFVTDISRWPEIGRAHREAFPMSPPVSTVVEVRRLFDDRLLVEIEVDAFVS